MFVKKFGEIDHFDEVVKKFKFITDNAMKLMEKRTWSCSGDTYTHFAALFSHNSHYFQFLISLLQERRKHVSPRPVSVDLVLLGGKFWSVFAYPKNAVAKRVNKIVVPKSLIKGYFRDNCLLISRQKFLKSDNSMP